jgi:hypothetical protein
MSRLRFVDSTDYNPWGCIPINAVLIFLYECSHEYNDRHLLLKWLRALCSELYFGLAMVKSAKQRAEQDVS